MSRIQLTIFEDAEKWLRENFRDLGWDSVAAVYPLESFNPDRGEKLGRTGETKYEDREEASTKFCSMSDHVRALQLLCEQIGRTLFVGGLKSPFDLIDAGNWDVEVVDAYFQLVYHGKVIYG